VLFQVRIADVIGQKLMMLALAASASSFGDLIFSFRLSLPLV
jgi:hypothetical protein